MFTVSKSLKSLGKPHSILVIISIKALPPQKTFHLIKTNEHFGKADWSIPRCKLKINPTVAIVASGILDLYS